MACTGGIAAKALPPLWFVGPARNAGGLGDRQPCHAHGRDRLTSTTRARSDGSLSQPVAALSRTGGHRDCRLADAAVLTLVASLWNSRRCRRWSVDAPAIGAAPWNGSWFTSWRDDRCARRVFFTLQTLSRRVSHRAAMAASLAVGVSLGRARDRSQRTDRRREIETISVAALRGADAADRQRPERFPVRHTNPLLRATTPSASRGRERWTIYFRCQARRPGSRSSSRRSQARDLHAVILGPRLAALHFGVGLASRCRPRSAVSPLPPRAIRQRLRAGRRCEIAGRLVGRLGLCSLHWHRGGAIGAQERRRISLPLRPLRIERGRQDVGPYVLGVCRDDRFRRTGVVADATSEPCRMNPKTIVLILAAIAAELTLAGCSSGPAPLSPRMSMFVTSVGLGDGGNLHGVAGADAHCQRLAAAAGSTRSWRAYLSVPASGNSPAINARERIGSGPWFNQRGTRSQLSRVVAQRERGHHVSNRARPSRAGRCRRTFTTC